jgi:hypothetical protein
MQSSRTSIRLTCRGIWPGGDRPHRCGWLNRESAVFQKGGDQTAEGVCKGTKHVLLRIQPPGSGLLLGPTRPIKPRQLRTDNKSIALSALSLPLNISVALLW